MTEAIPENLVLDLPKNLMEFKGYASAQHANHPLYKDPTPGEVRQLIKLMGWVGTQVARLTGVESRTVRRWQSPIELGGHRQIPYAAWRLLLAYSGVAQITKSESERLLAEVKRNKLEDSADGI